MEDEENEAQRLADGEVVATAAAREAAASLVELAAYDAMTHAEEATPPRVRTARAAAAAAALREVAAEPPLQPSFSQQRASLRRRATAETADIVREANAATVGNHLDTIRSLQREAEAAPSQSGFGPRGGACAARRACVDRLRRAAARCAAARPIETPAS